jgi:hypothetical protein
VIPTVSIKSKSTDVLATDAKKGYISANRYPISSSKDLHQILAEALNMFHEEGGKYSIKTDSQNAKEFPNMEALVEDVYKRKSNKKIIIQPFFETGKMIRGFHCPPKTKLFVCNNAANSETTLENCEISSQILEGTLPAIEDQCKHLFSSLQKDFFPQHNFSLQGMVFDFVEYKSL